VDFSDLVEGDGFWCRVAVDFVLVVMAMRLERFFVAFFLVVVCQGFSAEPIAEREWTSDAGTKLTASAMELRGDTVIFNSSDGRQIDVPLARLVEADQAILREHFMQGEEGQDAKPEEENVEPVKKGKGEFPGEVRENIKAGELGALQTYLAAYIPSSVKADAKRPAFCYVDMRKSSAETLDKFKAGSEVTGWLVVLSTEMSGGLLEEFVDPLAEGWLAAMKNELPVDVERLYGGAYSSGLKGLMQIREILGDYDGVLTVNGSFSKEDTGLPVCYGLVGLSAKIRVNFTKYFEKQAERDSLMRFTADGRGDASPDDYEDGMIFLAIQYYSDDGARKPEELIGFVDRLLERIQAVSDSDPERAYMWIKQSEELKKNDAQQAKWESLQTKLGQTESCKAYYTGFELFEDLGFKVIAEAESTVDEKANKKIEKELARMKEELEGTKWIPVIESYGKED